MNPPVNLWYLMTSHSWKNKTKPKSNVTPGFFFQPGVTLDSLRGGLKIWQIFFLFYNFLLGKVYELFYLIYMLFHGIPLTLVHFIFKYIFLTQRLSKDFGQPLQYLLSKVDFGQSLRKKNIYQKMKWQRVDSYIFNCSI